MTNSIDWLKARPIAHRGLHDVSQRVVENSRTAFARAIAGNYAIECDLQLSGDGEAMVFHDPDLARLTRAQGNVNTLSAQELRKISLRDSDDHMQTLEELLQQVADQVPLVIELKSLVDGNLQLAERAVEVLDKYQGRYCIMSFAPMLMNAVRSLSPETLRGAVVMPETEHLWTQSPAHDSDAATLLEEVDPHFISYDVNGLPSAFLREFQSGGKPTICWTIKDQKMADFAYNYCDQITFEGFIPK